MKLFALTTALVVAATAPALANDQLARSLGVEPGLLTTAQLVQVKASVDNANDNRVAKELIERFTSGDVSTMSTGISAGHAQLAANLGLDPAEFSVAQLAQIKASINNADDNRAAKALIERFSSGDVSTMSTGISAGHAQLAANLGLDPAEYSLAELAGIKGSYDSTDPTN